MADRASWQDAFDRSPSRPARFETMSGVPLEPVYGPEDGELPGRYPYTRGPYASMYRSRLWTMRQFAGFGTAEDTNERFQELLRAGGDGLSTAFDMPTLLGRDSDDPLALGEVGRAGVAVDTLADMETLFAGIDLGRGHTSMTINSPAAPTLLAMYVGARATARVSTGPRLGGTIQNDILKEYQAQKEYVFPPRPSVRLVTDVMRFCTRRAATLAPGLDLGLPHPRSGIDGRPGARLHVGQRVRLRRGGDGGGARGRRRSRRVSASSSTRTSTSSRRSPSTAPRDASGPAGCVTATAPPTSGRCQLRFHTQTAGVSLTAQQPEVNIARVAIEALAGVLGGTQSLHTDAFDEALALPTEHAARIALRTQQVIADETGVVHVADPLGGSWFVEELTDELERQAEDVFAHLDDAGSRLHARRRVRRASTTAGSQAEIADAAYDFQRKIARGEWVHRGCQRLRRGRRRSPPTLSIDPAVEDRQLERLAEVKQARDDDAVRRSLARIRRRGGRPRGQPHARADRGGAALRHGGRGRCGALETVFGLFVERNVA